MSIRVGICTPVKRSTGLSNFIALIDKIDKILKTQVAIFRKNIKKCRIFNVFICEPFLSVGSRPAK